MKNKRFMRLLLIFIITIMAIEPAFAATTVTSKYTGTTYTNNDMFDNSLIVNGIDVSEWQKVIDWEKVKADGIDFAIIRVGGRGYGAAGRLYSDTYYKENLENAKKAGIMIGVYFFSQAITEAEAVEEANLTLELLNGFELELPVIMDYEYASDSANPGRLNTAKLTKEQATKNVKAFCSTIEAAGYKSGVYANLLFLNNSIDGAALSSAGYFMWAAQYYNVCQYTSAYNIWQYSSSGSVSGISGRTDCNFWYLNKVSNVTRQKSIAKCTITVDDAIYTGEKNYQTAVTVSYNGTLLKEGVDYKVGYINNRNVGEAYAYIVGIGDYADYQTVPFEIFELGTDSIAEVSRYAGSTRYDTSLEIAEQLKALSGSNKFNTVIVAYGNDFADALSSSYLSYVNDNAPIILVDSTNETRIKNYIDANLAEDGKVYIIGGTGVVSSKFETSLRNEAYTVKRLSGADRYLTNIEILKEANVNKEELLICSGLDYADGISASAAKKPILLVGTSLTSAQRQYLRSIEGENMILIGGTGAVTETVESELKALGKDTTTRIYGRTRYETSVEVAKQLIGTDATTVTLACGDDYPDGLSGGPLAMKLGSALVIVNGSNTKMASSYVKQLTVETFAILGGKAILPDAAIKMITRQ